MSAQTLKVTNAKGDVVAEYPDFAPGQLIQITVDRQGANIGDAADGYAFRGPSRHPQYAVIEHLRTHTTVEVERERISLRA